MLGGSLTRYYPPYLPRQMGEGITDDFKRIAAPVVMESVRVGRASWQSTRQVAGQALK